MVLMPLLEEKVFEGVLLILLPCLVEIVHVQLTDKGGVVVVTEIDREDGL